MSLSHNNPEPILCIGGWRLEDASLCWPHEWMVFLCCEAGHFMTSMLCGGLKELVFKPRAPMTPLASFILARTYCTQHPVSSFLDLFFWSQTYFKLAMKRVY